MFSLGMNSVWRWMYSCFKVFFQWWNIFAAQHKGPWIAPRVPSHGASQLGSSPVNSNWLRLTDTLTVAFLRLDVLWNLISFHLKHHTQRLGDNWTHLICKRNLSIVYQLLARGQGTESRVLVQLGRGLPSHCGLIPRLGLSRSSTQFVQSALHCDLSVQPGHERNRNDPCCHEV